MKDAEYDKIICPHCKEKEEVRVAESAWLDDAMEAWECFACDEPFTVHYIVTVEKVTT